MGAGIVIAGMAMQSLRIALSPMPLRNDRFLKEIVQEGCRAAEPQGRGTRDEDQERTLRVTRQENPLHPPLQKGERGGFLSSTGQRCVHWPLVTAFRAASSPGAASPPGPRRGGFVDLPCRRLLPRGVVVETPAPTPLPPHPQLPPPMPMLIAEPEPERSRAIDLFGEAVVVERELVVVHLPVILGQESPCSRFSFDSRSRTGRVRPAGQGGQQQPIPSSWSA